MVRRKVTSSLRVQYCQCILDLLLRKEMGRYGKLLHFLLHCNSSCACLRQASKFHHQAFFVNKIICISICTLCAWVSSFFLQEVNSCGILSCNLFHLGWIILRLRFTLSSNKPLVKYETKVDLVGISFWGFSIAFLCIMTLVFVVIAFL